MATPAMWCVEEAREIVGGQKTAATQPHDYHVILGSMMIAYRAESTSLYGVLLKFYRKRGRAGAHTSSSYSLEAATSPRRGALSGPPRSHMIRLVTTRNQVISPQAQESGAKTSTARCLLFQFCRRSRHHCYRGPNTGLSVFFPHQLPHPGRPVQLPPRCRLPLVHPPSE